MRGGLALVRPAGSAVDERQQKEEAADRQDNASRAWDLGREGVRTVSDAIGREQERAARDRELQSREEIERIRAQRDRDIARIRAEAEANMRPGDRPGDRSPPQPQFEVLRATSEPNAANVRRDTSSGGVLQWIKDNPLETAIGATAVVIVVGGIAYVAMKKSKKRRSS